MKMKMVFQFLIVMLVAMAMGCAATPKGRATQLVVASDGAADEISAGYESYVDAKVAECDAKLDPETNTKEDAKDCMGMASSDEGKRLLKMMEVLVAAQLAIKIAIECESNPLKVPKEFKTKCIDGQKADWKALAASLISAWEGLAPFFEAVRKHAGGK